MHGYDNGLSMLQSLCCTHDIIVLQELHDWLQDCELNKFDSIDRNFKAFAVTSMTKKLSSGLLVGRPHGGCAIMWRKKLDNFVSLIKPEDFIEHPTAHHCVIGTLTLNALQEIWVLIYFNKYAVVIIWYVVICSYQVKFMMM